MHDRGGKKTNSSYTENKCLCTLKLCANTENERGSLMVIWCACFGALMNFGNTTFPNEYKCGRGAAIRIESTACG